MPDGSLVIGAAGIYHHVPMEQYLECEAVGASDCWNMEKFCPRYAYVRHPICPDREPGRESEALSIGSLAHTLILEGENVAAERFAMKPEGMRFNTTEGKAWQREQEDAGLEIVTEADWIAARFWAAAIKADATAMAALAECDAEVTLLAKDTETGLAIKSRPDAMRGNLAVNIKTAASAKTVFWASDARKYGYMVSQAMTDLVLKSLQADPRPYVFLVIEKAKRWPIIEHYTLPEQLALEGELIVRKSLRRWAECAERGVWPTYAGDVHEVPVPGGTLQSIERLQQEIYG